MMRDKKIILILFLLAIFLFQIQKAEALGMSSTNYKINADVIGAGGGLGSSANYKLFDTAGEPIVSIGSSENYKGKLGFEYMLDEPPTISILVDSNTVDLGTVTAGTPEQGQSTLSVTTNSYGGYDLLASENHALLHTDTTTTIADYSGTIASPTAWSGTGFGFTLTSGTNVESKWGTSPNFAYAGFPLTDTLIHEKTGYKSGADDTVVGYNIDVASTQLSGTYSNTVTYTAAVKL